MQFFHLPPARQRGVRNPWVVALITLAVIGVVFTFLVARRWNPQSEQHAITYRVTGSAPNASVIYMQPDGQRDATVPLPWSSSLFHTNSGMQLSLVARASGGSITCVISEDGNTVATHTGSDCSLGAKS